MGDAERIGESELRVGKAWEVKHKHGGCLPPLQDYCQRMMHVPELERLYGKL